MPAKRSATAAKKAAAAAAADDAPAASDASTAVAAAGQDSFWPAAPDSVSRMTSLFPLTHPLPTPENTPELIPSADVALEQDLLLNDLNPRSWKSYIDHVVTSNQPMSAYESFPPDSHLDSTQVALLGPLASTQARLALKRITFVYERALARFSGGTSSFTLWRNYLLRRMTYVLGKPKGGVDAFYKRQITAGKTNLEVGPSLVEAKDEEEQWEGGLDGRVGFREWASLAAVFERALMYFPTMPRIWLLYFQLFIHPLCPSTLSHTHARRTFDRALRVLPGSLHLRVWKLYLHWAEQRGGETCLRIWRRYLKVDPSLTERYVKILLKLREEQGDDDEEEEEAAGQVDASKTSGKARTLEAAKLLLALANEALHARYTSPEGKSPYQLLLEWLDLCETYPEEVGYAADDERTASHAPNGKQASGEKGKAVVPHGTAPVAGQENQVLRACDLQPLDTTLLPVRRIVLDLGIERFPDQAGRLWSGLATYHIKRGELDEAKQTFEEGMKAVVTVRDFTQIFDAYAETSENIIGFLMEEVAAEEEDEEEEEGQTREDKERDLDQRMKDFEELMERRPFLVNEVLLRRNPHDVQEWEKRVALFGDDDANVVKTYTEAIEAINPRKATANFHQLFINFARFYEEGGSEGRRAVAEGEEAPEPNLDEARKILEKATTVPFRRVDDLADVWCEWAEMEVRHDNFDEALRVMARAGAAPRSAAEAKAISYYDETLPPQKRLFKSLRLWSFHVDLEESIGSIEGAKAVYDRIMELRIANPQIIINYAAFLEENRYFEEAFKVYERGVEAFTYPVAFEIWNVYLAKFVKRYGGNKIERARDLFEQALETCPPKFAKPIFLKYGSLEEEHGLAKRAMSIYERATMAVSDDDRFDMFTFYIAKAAANFGLAATRPIYERAIEVLPDRQTAEMCLRFAALERKLGEIDRARAIYAHASQFCDPRTQPSFWKAWNDFEIETGSEDTFREFLRIKRSVQAQFNTDASYIAASALAASKRAAASNGTSAAAPSAVPVSDPMAMAEAEAAAAGGAKTGTMGFVKATTTGQKPSVEATNNDEVIGGEGDGEGDDDDDLM